MTDVAGHQSESLFSEQEKNRLLVEHLSACAEGNKAALKSMYHLTAPQLYATLLRILKREALADEALQETFTKVWTRAHQFDSARAQPMVWLNRIARNQAIDMIRHKSSRVEREIDEKVDIELDDHADRSGGTPELDLLNTDLLNFCLAQLQPQPRQCVVAAYCEGYSHEELSTRLKKPVGTVKSWIRRSLLALRKCIDENG